MQFTEKEIELAKQLKEAGLEWVPCLGDHFWDGDIYLLGTAYWDGFEMSVVDGSTIHHYVASDYLREHCTWLPQQHQCREVMLEKGWRLITLMDTPQQVEWRTHLVFERLIDKEVHCSETTGGTDLEAMYKALLEVINNAS